MFFKKHLKQLGPLGQLGPTQQYGTNNWDQLKNIWGGSSETFSIENSVGSINPMMEWTPSVENMTNLQMTKMMKKLMKEF